MSSADTTSSKVRICTGCGDDLNGKKRYKDEAGEYWCPACNKDMTRKQGKTRVRCPFCEQVVTEASLITYELTRICPTCYSQRTAEGRKSKFSKFDQYARREEIKKVKWMGVVVVLVMIFGMWKGDLFPQWFGGSADKSELRELMANTLFIAVSFLAAMVGFAFWLKKQL
jgi:hypothetical protein